MHVITRSWTAHLAEQSGLLFSQSLADLMLGVSL